MTQLTTHPSLAVEESIRVLVSSTIGGAMEGVRVSTEGTRVILRGSVPSYAEKSAAEATLRLAGYSDIDNCLRVVPAFTI